MGAALVSSARAMKLVLVMAIAGLALVTSGCDVLGTSSADAVKVQLNEWAIAADPVSAPAGSVTFEVTNNGERVHGFAVLEPDEETGTQFIVIGEIDVIEPEDTRSLTVALAEGALYELASLRVTVEDGAVVSDYDRGMRLEFAVE